MDYLHWNETTETDPLKAIELYDRGYLYTRINKGVLQQTRSIRINLAHFEPSSENRRVLRKTEHVSLSHHSIPYADYHWSIGKLGKDFYSTKFGDGIMSAQKIKEAITDTTKSNWNKLLTYSIELPEGGGASDKGFLGYTICFEAGKILHYSYPFYDLKNSPTDMGLGMMTKALVDAKERGLDYVYLGSLQRPTDTYKLQFKGIEWFDGTQWQTSIDSAKEILKGSK